MKEKILITGAAGFIGSALSIELLKRGANVFGIDNLNDYYDVQLKQDRLSRTLDHQNFSFKKIDISDGQAVKSLFAEHEFDVVVNLAAQAGVRYSIENPHAYIESNINGFMNIIEGCRYQKVKHFVYASSSSVYGANTKLPFSEHHNIDHPVSLYAATKKSNELIAHTYSHLYGLATTGLRFFTVYGPWGRPDMALFKFTRGILAGEPIPVFNHGKMERDFTYIDDIVDGVVRVIETMPLANPDWCGDQPDPATSYTSYRVYNIGNHKPVKLMDFIGALENKLGVKAKLDLLPMQAGDVPATYADIDALNQVSGFVPKTNIEQGIDCFVDWYKKYYAT